MLEQQKTTSVRGERTAEDEQGAAEDDQGGGAMLQDHVRRMKKLVRDSKDPSKRKTMPPDFKTRPLCKIKVSGSWRIYSVADAENVLTIEYPQWDRQLISCPPGILYDEQKAIKLYDGAKDLVVKNNRKVSFKWRDKNECNSYRKRFGRWERRCCRWP